MRREDNLKAKRREKIEQIIRALSDKADNSPVVAELLRELLLSNEDDPDYGGSIYEIYRKDMVARDVASRESLERLAQLKTRLGVPAAETPKAVPAPKRSLRRVAGLRIASVAAALLVVASAAFWLTDADNRTTGRTAATTIAAATQTAPQACIKVETVEGVQKDITLQDNTKVWVNAETKISYPETFEDSREVYLAQGEAYFAVERDEEKPFTVHTENLQIKVLGTKFNVTENGEKGITEVVLHEGSVAVLAGDRTETLVPDQKLTYYHLTGELTVERVAQEAAAADWRAEGIRADLKTVPQLLRMIANYYDLRVVYESSQDSMALAAGELCSIQFRKGDSPNTVLHILSEICQGLEYEINDDTIFIK